LIGCGWIAEIVHMPLLRANSQVTVAAYSDRIEARRAVAGRFFPEATGYIEALELLRDDSLDAVVVALPPSANALVVTAALEAGKNVYVEKPLAPTAQEGAAIVSAWRQSQGILMLGYNFRYSPVFEDALQRVQSGALGEIVTIQSRFTWRTDAVTDWRASASTGGGVLLDLASHHIDLTAALSGVPAQTVAAHERSIRHRGDTVDLLVEGANGVRFQIHASHAGGANANRLSILGTEGHLEVDMLDARPRAAATASQSLARLRRIRNAAAEFHPARILRSPGHEPSFGRAVNAFVTGCLTGEQPEPGPDAGLLVLETVEAARRSAAKGGAPVPIEPAPSLVSEMWNAS
jgi:predicted dehydrogenase